MIRKRLLALGVGVMLAASVLSGCGNSSGGSSETTGNGVSADGEANFAAYETQYFTESTNPDSLGILFGDNTKDGTKKFSAVMKITYPDIAKGLVGTNLPGNSDIGHQVTNDIIMAPIAAESPIIYNSGALSEDSYRDYYKHRMVNVNYYSQVKDNYNKYVIAEQDDDAIGWCLYATSEKYAQENNYYVAYRIPNTVNTKMVHEFKVYVSDSVIDGANNPGSLDKYKEVYNWCKEHIVFGVAHSDIDSYIVEGSYFADDAYVTTPGVEYKDAYGNNLGNDYVMGQDVYVKALSEKYNINIPNAQLSFNAYDDARIKEDLNKLHNLDTNLYKIYSTYQIAKNINSVARASLDNSEYVCDIQINGDTYKLVKDEDKDAYTAYRDADDNVTICLTYKLMNNIGGDNSGILNKDDVIKGIQMIYAK